MKTSLLAVLAVVVAYPWALIAVPLIAVGLIRNFNGTCLFLVVCAAVVMALYIICPSVPRTIAALQRFWSRKVFEIWKLIEMKRTISSAESRINTTVLTRDDLGGEPDAKRTDNA